MEHVFSLVHRLILGFRVKDLVALFTCYNAMKRGDVAAVGAGADCNGTQKDSDNNLFHLAAFPPRSRTFPG